MAVLRRFFCLELEIAAIVIGIVSLLLSFASMALASSENYVSPKPYPIVYGFIDLLASGSLIFGTIKRNRYLLLPWLVMQFIDCFIFTLIIIGGIIIATREQMQKNVTVDMADKTDEWNPQFIDTIDQNNPELNMNMIIIVLIGCCALYALCIYMMMAVASLYSRFRNENQENIVMFVRHESSPPYNFESYQSQAKSQFK